MTLLPLSKEQHIAQALRWARRLPLETRGKKAAYRLMVANLKAALR